jgi:ABC-type nitrate/sulfonate/bicarbonate transport system substrate-binding protein
MILTAEVVCAALTVLCLHHWPGGRIRVAIPGYNITQIVFFTAKERGYYKEEGLDVDPFK